MIFELMIGHYAKSDLKKLFCPKCGCWTWFSTPRNTRVRQLRCEGHTVLCSDSYGAGLKAEPAYTLDLNLIFEISSNVKNQKRSIHGAEQQQDRQQEITPR